MKNETLLITDSMKIDYFFDENLNHQHLAYVFTPSLNRNLDGNAYGGELLARNGFDTIAFKVLNDDWFQSIPLELFEKINNINSKKGYVKRVAYGSSMGGYAAIAFSKHLNCSTSITISPQYCIDEEFDTRWFKYAKNINFKYKISKDSVQNDCKFFIFYDNKNLDKLQVEKLVNILPPNRTELVTLPYTGHPCTDYLSEVGLIKELLVKIAKEDSIQGIDFLAKKKLSKFYFEALSVCLFRKKHPKWALFAIDSALKIDSKFSRFHFQKSVLLDKIGKIDASVKSLKYAIYFDSGNPYLHCNLSDLFFRNNVMEDALSAIDTALKIDADVAVFHRHKGAVLDKMGKVDEAIKSMCKAITLDPNNSHQLIHLNHMLNRQ